MQEKGQGENAEILAEALRAREQEEARRRALVRPRISVWRAVWQILLPLAVAAGVFCAFYFPFRRLALALGVSLGGLGLYVLLRLRDILLWCIHVYQHCAPDEVRMRCVFTPSCSEYAEQALRRYGVCRALPKIFSRLHRCHPPNGGDDPL